MTFGHQEETVMLKKWALMAAVALALAPASASADWLFTPNIGAGFGGNAEGRNHLTYGASIGWMGAGVLGWEADFAYTPEFFEGDDDDLDAFDGDSNVTTVMGNVLLGVPIGGQTGGGVRPYVAAGAGLMQSRVEDADALFEIDNNDFGVNVGGGIMGFMTDNVGFRGDIRYFRAFGEDDSNEAVDFDLSDFDFWRGTVGVTFRW
jgi:opacity protein-like surface antigen